MTYDTSAPDTSSEFNALPAPTRKTSFRLKIEAALHNRRLLGVVLLLVMTGLVSRTLLFARETPERRDLSDLYMDTYEALKATKSSYLPELIYAPSTLTITPVPAAPPPGATKASNHHPISAPNRLSHSAARRLLLPRKAKPSSQTPTKAWGDLAITKWQDTAHSKRARAAEWRRLGIALALFHRPGALNALAHVGDKFAPPLASPRPKRVTMESGNSDIDPLGHGPTGVDAAREWAAWQTLYGPGQLSPIEVYDLQATLRKLRLGWFEPIVLAQLYQKAGLRAQAKRMANEAGHSADRVRALDDVRLYGLELGFVGILLWCVFALVRFFNRAHSLSDARTGRVFNRQITAPALFGLPTLQDKYASLPETDQTERPALPNGNGDAPALAASALMLAFIAYLVGHTGFGLLMRQIMLPFADRLDSLPATRLLRLSFALQLLLYTPIFLVPLWTLRARLVSYRLASPSLRLKALLAQLGCRCRSLPYEAGVGAGAYVLLMPGILLAGMVSHQLFHRFHTPVNPAQFETMAAQHLPDKILIFILAAIIAPIVEETMFRGLLYSAFRARYGVMGAAMLSAAIFSLVHPTLPGGFLTIWAIGVALALVYEQRKSLVPGMILHGIHNGLITLIGFAVFGSG